MINILSILSFLFAHEFYVSVSYMEYDSDRKAIEVQKKIFFDDFEVALKKQNNLKKFDILKSKKEQLLVPPASIIGNKKLTIKSM